jgi:hypothetical protein
LWWHLAEQLPLKSKDPCEYQAGLLLLIGVAAASPGDLDDSVAQTLHAIGWMHSDGTPLTRYDAAHAALDTRTALHLMSVLAGKAYRGEERSTPDGIAFARAALRTWP